MKATRILAAPVEVLSLGGGGTVLVDLAAAALSEGPFFRFPWESGEAGELEAAASGLVVPGGGALTSGKKGTIAQQVIAAVPAWRNYAYSIQTCG